MVRRSFNSELSSLIFILNAHPLITSDINARKIIDDFNETLAYNRMRQRRRYLIWGLLIGRCVDFFTEFFLIKKRRRINRGDRNRHGRPVSNTFNHRIEKICGNLRTCPALTGDPSINADLHYVRDKRNDLFHEPGRHFSQLEMKNFVFKSVKSMMQLVSDL